MWRPYKIDTEIELKEFYSAFIRTMSPSYVFRGESHDFWEFVYLIDGNAETCADDRIINLSKNHIVFHKPMEFHTLRPKNNKDAVFFIMSFSAKGKGMEKFKDKVFYLGDKQYKNLIDIIDFLKLSNDVPKENTSPVAFLYKMENDKFYGQELKILVERFLISLLNINDDYGKYESNESFTYRQVLNIIENTLNEDISVFELAERCNVSTAYLKKIFSKYTGKGIHEYILELKMTLAKQMLKSGLSVTDVAESLAFSSQNYFSCVFKKRTGFSPSEYKKISNQL